MIRNLNQMDFKGYGTVGPERPPSAVTAVTDSRRVLQLQRGTNHLFRATSSVQLYYSTGMTVLSVSLDGQSFQHFYLDKPVLIHSGVWFCLSPFLNEAATAEFSCTELPEVLGTMDSTNDLVPRHRLWVTGLHTFFYHEKEKGFFFPGESHPMLELTYVDQGQLHSVADGQNLVLEQGDLVIYAPNQWHMQYADMEVAPRYVTISFDLEGSDVSVITGRKFKIPPKSALLLQQLLREQDHSDEFSYDMLISLLNTLLIQLARSAESPATKLRSSNAVHSENEIIRRAQQFISTHVREKLSVPLVARSVDVSPSYLTALFHNNLKISPGEYIRRVKLQESKQMIREDNLNFTEIAAALQYSTVHHFSRQFKEKFGMTPTEYAKSVR